MLFSPSNRSPTHSSVLTLDTLSPFFFLGETPFRFTGNYLTILLFGSLLLTFTSAPLYQVISYLFSGSYIAATASDLLAFLFASLHGFDLHSSSHLASIHIHKIRLFNFYLVHITPYMLPFLLTPAIFFHMRCSSLCPSRIDTYTNRWGQAYHRGKKKSLKRNQLQNIKSENTECARTQVQ